MDGRSHSGQQRSGFGDTVARGRERRFQRSEGTIDVALGGDGSRLHEAKKYLVQYVGNDVKSRARTPGLLVASARCHDGQRADETPMTTMQCVAVAGIGWGRRGVIFSVDSSLDGWRGTEMNEVVGGKKRFLAMYLSQFRFHPSLPNPLLHIHPISTYMYRPRDPDPENTQ